MFKLEWVLIDGEDISIEVTPFGTLIGRYKYKREDPMSELKMKMTRTAFDGLILASYELIPDVYGVGKSTHEAAGDLISREICVKTTKEVTFNKLRHTTIARAYGRVGLGTDCQKALHNLICPHDNREVNFGTDDNGDWSVIVSGFKMTGGTADTAYALASEAQERQVASIPHDIVLSHCREGKDVLWSASKVGCNFYGNGPTAEIAYKNWREMWVGDLHKRIRGFLRYYRDSGPNAGQLYQDWEQYRNGTGTNDNAN